MYLSLWESCAKITIEYLTRCGCYGDDELFESMERGFRAKMEIIRRYPDMANFTIRAFYEKDPEVSAAVQQSYRRHFNLKSDRTRVNLDAAQFVEGLDIEMMYREMYWAAEGYLWEMTQRGEVDVEQMARLPQAHRLLEAQLFEKGVNRVEAIRIEGLTKYYGRIRGVEDVRLSVARGEFFGFVGPNGAGKSTTIRALLGLIRPSRGSAQLLGMDIGTEQKKIHARVGYLPSEVAFYSGMRAGDLLRFSASLRGRDCARQAAELCERLQLDPRRRAEELSLGNRKKLAIACALQHEPELLILDEPTSGLDPLMQREFFDILRERNAAGTTIFLSSHILGEVQRHCQCAAKWARWGRCLPPWAASAPPSAWIG